MSFLSLALIPTLLLQAPQGGGQDGTAAGKPQGLLSPAERAAIREKLVKYLAEDAAYHLSTGKDRDKASKKHEAAKEAFDEAWKKAGNKGNLMASMVDLRGVFENCFTLKQPSVTLGQLRPEKTALEALEYNVFLPAKYKATAPARTVIVLPSTIDAAKTDQWAKPAEHFAATWDKSPSVADTFFLIPTPSAKQEYDPVPDLTREAGEADEQGRIKMVLLPLGDLMQNYNIERSRVFLDGGRGSCGFALRLMTMFPDRFAGAVLRAPVAVDDIRLGSLLGLPILLLRTAATAAAVDALKKRLDEATPGTTTVLDATDEYPHKAHTADIEAWLGKQRRNAMPMRIVIEPNHDKFNRAYWGDIITADLLATSQPDKKPRLECIADRAANRITVKAVGVEQFKLFLNDDLLDLDKEFTVVVNDKAFGPEKKTRSFRDMKEGMLQRNDWDFLFPAAFTSNVPK